MRLGGRYPRQQVSIALALILMFVAGAILPLNAISLEPRYRPTRALSRDSGAAQSAAEANPHTGVTYAVGVAVVVLVLTGVGLGVASETSRESKDRLAKIFRASPLPISISTRESAVYVDVNDALLKLLKYERNEMIGHSALDLNVWVDPEDRVRILHGRGSGKAQTVRTRMRTSQGEIREVTLSSELIELDGVVCVLAITQDVTDALLLEDQFRQAQKMEAVGRLAGGLAHDLNNLLTVTMGYSELSLQQLEPSHPVVRNLVQIKGAADRAASLTRRLLGFCRQQILFPRILDLNVVIESVNQMLLRMIGEDVSLVFKPGVGLGRIRADLSQIEQVLINLIVNARDAMPAGGVIVVETSNVTLEDSYVDLHVVASPGRYVMLSVSDTGSGIDEETKGKIFEPFFTTKPPGQGSGLGLSTVYGIVKQSEGHIWVYSEPGMGTTFKLYFPRREEHADPMPGPMVEAEPPPGSETILVVEDDNSLRELTVALLENEGYKVLQSSSADAAVALMQEGSNKVDLLLSDILLPDLNGVELAALLKKEQPNLRVLLVSGYAGSLIARHQSIDPSVTLLEKPFSRRGLLSTIHSLLHPTQSKPQSRNSPHPHQG